MQKRGTGARAGLNHKLPAFALGKCQVRTWVPPEALNALHLMARTRGQPIYELLAEACQEFVDRRAAFDEAQP